jgi:hypothetical protein
VDECVVQLLHVDHARCPTGPERHRHSDVGAAALERAVVRVLDVADGHDRRLLGRIGRGLEANAELDARARLLQMDDGGHSVEQDEQHGGRQPFHAQEAHPIRAGVHLRDGLVVRSGVRAVGADVHGRPAGDQP